MRTKNIILLLACVFLSINSYAQTSVSYTYDSAGNRTGRAIAVSKGLDAGRTEDSAIKLAEGLDTASYIISSNKESAYDILSRVHYSDPEAKRDYHAFYERVLADCNPGRSRNTVIDTTCAVERIPLTSGTTPTGAKTFSIAVPAASGLALTPSISLDYSSQAGNGAAGYGWSIGGLSSISIRNKNSYYDDVIVPADINDASAAYCLDGIPLVVNDIAGLYSEGYTLQTTQGHIVVKKNVSGGVVTHFTVLFPDGSKATYGWTGNSQNLVSYPITEKTDIHGNKITYLYHPASSPSQHRRVYEIRYGFTSSNIYQGKISFSYSQRSDICTAFRAGVNVTDKWLLNGITSYSYNGTSYDKICQYDLHHTLLEGVNQLTRVDASSGSSSLNPVLFQYNAQEQYRSYNESLEEAVVGQLESFYSSPTDSYIYKRGKFTLGDFSDGVIIYPDLDQYDPSQSLLVAPDVNAASIGVNWLTAGAGFKSLESADANGDGRDELIKLNLGVSGNKTRLSITKYTYTGSGPNPWATITQNVLLQGVINDGGTYRPAPRDCFFGDFDGDGKVELITVSHRDPSQGLGTSYYSLIDLEYLILESEGSNLFNYPTITDYKIIPIDIDGDGRTELCSFSSGGDMRLYNSTATSLALTKTITCGDVRLFDNHGPHFADINGDGYMDLVRIDSGDPGTGSGEWSAYYYTGSTLEYTSEPEGTQLYGYEGVLFMDLNRDGISDVIVLSGNDLKTGINRKNGVFDFSGASPLPTPPGFNIIPCSLKDYVLRSRFVSIDQSGTVKTYNFSDDRSSGRLVGNVTDSYGNKEFLLYRNMAEQMEVYGNDAYIPTLAQGYYRLIAPLNLLWQDTVVSGDISSSRSFEYSDLVANHKRGFGICGFAKVSENDNLSQICTKTIYDPERFGIVMNVKDSLLVNPPAGNLPRVAKTVINTYTDVNYTYRKLVPRLTGSVTRDALTGIISSRTVSYTDYDLPSAMTESRRIGETSSPQTYSESYTYENTTSPGRYILGSVTQKHTRSDLDGDGTFWKRQESYTYSFSGQPTSVIFSEGPDNSGTTRTLETRYTYDSYGNMLSEKSAKYNATSYYGWTYTYDSNGRYLASKTDAIGRKTQYGNYDKWGKPHYVKDYNRNKTTYHEYDSWGILIRTDYPDGSADTLTRRWGGAGLYTIAASSTGKPDRIVHYDALGRVIRNGERRFDGHWGYTDRTYNARGQLSAESLPYKDTTSAAAYWDTYTYDAYGRSVRKDYASGKYTTYSYNGTTTSTCDEGLTTHRVTDASGNVTQDMSYYGNLNYTYRDDGQLASVSAGGNQTTTYTYDNVGRKTGESDPSSGTRTMSYLWNSDGSSQVIQTNANGPTVTLYDAYGRVTSINYPGQFSTTFTYDSFGNLSAEHASGLQWKWYYYDSYDRLAAVTMSGPDYCYLEKEYAYAPGGAVSSIKYTDLSSVIETENYIYRNGHNTAIMLSDSTYVIRITQENALGQVTEAETEPATGPPPSHGVYTSKTIYRSYSFDEYGYPTGRKFSVKRGSMGHLVQVPLTEESYSFNHNTGNLQRRNSLRFHETFGYDFENRLYGNTQSNYWYGINGDISWRNDGGQQTFLSTGSDGYKLTGIRARTDSLVAPRTQTVAYTGFGRPDVITEGGRTCRFAYDAARNRMRMAVAEGDSTILKRWYVGDNFEIDSTAAGITERLYFGGTAYNAPMVLVRRTNKPDALFAIGRDYLGSITYLRRNDGKEDYEYNYDPWGNVRYADGDTLALSYRQTPELFLGRGFTGHEHLPWFGLINMNARLYDPVTTRFLSPDPLVRIPSDYQAWNPYAYCLNNPLKYTDQSGEFFVIDSFLIGLFSGGWERAKKMARNDLKIWGGLFTTDKKYKFWGGVGELLSRFTWQLPQTVIGFLTAHSVNTFRIAGGVDNVDYLHGATLLKTYADDKEMGAFTFGSFIIGNKSIEANDGNKWFQHEFGHYLQSQEHGLLWLFEYAIESGISAWVNAPKHNYFYTEQDANARSFKYLVQYYGFNYAKSNWNFEDNPIQGYDNSRSYSYNMPIIEGRIIHLLFLQK